MKRLQEVLTRALRILENSRNVADGHVRGNTVLLGKFGLDYVEDFKLSVAPLKFTGDKPFMDTMRDKMAKLYSAFVDGSIKALKNTSILRVDEKSPGVASSAEFTKGVYTGKGGSRGFVIATLITGDKDAAWTATVNFGLSVIRVRSIEKATFDVALTNINKHINKTYRDFALKAWPDMKLVK